MSSFPHHGYGTHSDTDPRPQAPLHLHKLPAGHGPASSSTRISAVNPLSSLAHAPAFVRSTGTYDELGRSIGDGVRADVVDGTAGQGSASSGEALAFWKGLQLQGTSSGTGPPSSTSPANAVASGSILSSTAAPTAPSTRTIVLPRDQWFIRRALLAKAAKERERDESGDATQGRGEVTSSSTPPPRPVTPSLASLLAADLPPPPTASDVVEGYQPPAYFHLRENNRGWQVLKNIGWDGQGGLGRVGEDVQTGTSEGKQVKREDDAPIAARTTTRGHMLTGESRESAIDLTLDSASSSPDTDSSRALSPRASPSEKFGEAFIAPHPPSPRNVGGSGRTAPIATYLKTDLRGIGALSSSARQRTLLRPSTLAAPSPDPPAKRKRVTHSVEDVRAAVRDARQAGDGLTGEDRVAWERKRAKRDGERDRRERQRWREIINRD